MHMQMPGNPRTARAPNIQSKIEALRIVEIL
jgi:hypothetical protein